MTAWISGDPISGPSKLSRRILLLRVAVWVGCLLPMAFLVYRGFTGGLTANPIEYLTHQTGFTSLTLLMVALSITPLRRLTGWNDLIRIRRPIGLFAFFYASIHLLIYLTFDHLFSLETILDDILKRPYITAGFLAFVLLIPLAVTSTKGWIRRLGRRWQLLHRLIYLSAALAVLHFYWKAASKADVSEPLLFAGILAALLLARVRYRELAHRLRRRNDEVDVMDRVEAGSEPQGGPS